jgi:hypothetical protein
VVPGVLVDAGATLMDLLLRETLHHAAGVLAALSLLALFTMNSSVLLLVALGCGYACWTLKP